MSQNNRYLVLVTRRKYRFFSVVKTYGPFNYQKALTLAYTNRDGPNKKTFIRADIHIAVKQINGPGTVPGSVILSLVRG